jgi:hypothetical protein
MTKKEFLGIDKLGKSWYFYRRRTDDNVVFFVVPEKPKHRTIPWKDQYILSLVVSLISKNRGIIEDFVHENSRVSSNETPRVNDNTHNEIYEQLRVQEPAREVKYSDEKYYHSLSEEPLSEVQLPNIKRHKSLLEVMNEFEQNNRNDDEDWENRGIGKLLLERVEKWARRARKRVLFGFISSHDDVEKLQKMYTKWGWQVRMFGKSSPKIRCYTGYTVGIVRKKL